MKAKIEYRMMKMPDPWNEEMRKGGSEPWCLVKEVTPEFGETRLEPVAIFNLDSEALMFQGHMLAEYDKGAPITVKLDVNACTHIRDFMKNEIKE